MAEIRDPSAWEDQLVTAVRDASARFDQAAEATPPQKKVLISREARFPAEQFFLSIPRGDVEWQSQYCEHVGPNPGVLFLVRGAKAWLLGCQPCVYHNLALDGQDTRCDWCGQGRPDRTPTVTLRVGNLLVVAQFCPSCMQKISA